MDKENRRSTGKYQFANTKDNYEDYSSGRVLYGTTGAANFPVRLSSELFQRCQHYLKKKGKDSPYSIWDPFCGAGYLITVLGFLHNSDIKTLFASDADATVLETADKNLSLLHTEGLKKRIDELKLLIDKYGKAAHKEALHSAHILDLKRRRPLQTMVFQFNMLEHKAIPGTVKDVDIIISDLPYGQLTEWIGLEDNNNPTQIFLNKVKSLLKKEAVIAIVADKKQKITYNGYNKIKTFTLGKRRIWLLEQSG